MSLDKTYRMKRKLKHITISGGAIVAVCLVVFLRVSGKNARANQPEESPLRPVAVTLAKRGPIVTSLTLSGAFRPYQEVDVHAKVAGYIRQIFVDVGDQVKAGQVLATLEVPELNAQVMGAKADILRSQGAVRRAQSEVERAESEYSAYHSAYTRLKQASEARPGLVAEQELDDSQAKDLESKAQVSSARSALTESQSQQSVAEANLERLAALEAYSHITAPFAGVVTKRYADTGALIQAGTASDTQSMPVVQLAEWSRLRLVVPVPESAVPHLHVGGTVQVHVSALNRNFEGQIARFAEALNNETRTMHTEIDIKNADGTLVEGMYADAKIVLDEHSNALTVPVQAIERNNSKATVLVVDSRGRIHENEVTLGVEGSDSVEILSGLAENDRVVIGSRSEFRSGDRVQPKIVADSSAEAEAKL
jgi:RND family efflux transporter MFP subunit